MTKEPSLPYYLPVFPVRIDGFMPFQTALAWSERQNTASRIWTQFVHSIPDDDSVTLNVPQEKHVEIKQPRHKSGTVEHLGENWNPDLWFARQACKLLHHEMYIWE